MDFWLEGLGRFICQQVLNSGVDANQAYALCANAYGKLFKDAFGKSAMGMQRVGREFVFLVDKDHRIYAKISNYQEMAGNNGKASWELFVPDQNENGDSAFGKPAVMSVSLVGRMVDPTLDDKETAAKEGYNKSASNYISKAKHNEAHPDNQFELSYLRKKTTNARTTLQTATAARKTQTKWINNVVSEIIRYLDTKEEQQDNGNQ